MKFTSLTGITLLVLLFSLDPGKAQDTQFGVKGGPNFHTVSGEDVENNQMRVAFHLGGFAQFGLTDDLYLRPELLYSLEGSGYEFEFLGETVNSVVNYNYITVPVMFRYSLGGFYLEGGPSIGFLLGGSQKFKDSDEDPEELDMENHNSMELAAELGAGYTLESGLSFGLRADIGLTGINDLEDAPEDATNTRNFGIRLSGAYAF
jgi:hypothetical protein